MNKLVLVITMAILLVILVAANTYPATLTVINATDGNVIISLQYPYTFLVVKPGSTHEFSIARAKYDSTVTACGATSVGTMNLNNNLKLNFTPCANWGQKSTPKFLGEPSMEKPNWNRVPGVAGWRFKY